ncbi:MAG: hypothetical protein JWP57_3771 [Spirosoma sp.]|nr:hypothetical protein [Spirosoma sp.]
MYGPVDNIIPRKADPAVEELMSKLNTVINSFVDFGSNILKWDTEVRRLEAYNTPIMMSFRHFLELTDSISIFIKESSVDPCKIILRGMLETYFNLEYLFKEDTANRGMAFLVWHLHEKIKSCEDADPTTERGKQLRIRLNKDKFTNNVKLPIEADPKIQAKKSSFEKRLKEPVYQKAEQEYQRLRNQGKKNPP